MQMIKFVRIVLSSSAWVDCAFPVEGVESFSFEQFVAAIITNGGYIGPKVFVPYHAIRNVVLLEISQPLDKALS